MKKVFGLIVMLVLSVMLVACAGTTKKTYKIALITDVGNIDDKSFNQASYEGVKEYAEKNNVTYSYYRPSEDSLAARMETISNAIEKGAKVVVCPGFLFEEAIYNVQDTYPEVSFLLLDGEPHNADYSVYRTGKNVHNILYQEEQAGYLAGYAVVMDGYRKLGFIGGMSVPAVVRYGYGYVQGAEAAAVELGLNAGDVTVKYGYAGSFSASDDLYNKMNGWYTAGTEIIFSCGGAIFQSVKKAAIESETAKIVGVDVDQYNESERVVTSAMKGLKASVILSLTKYFENNETWPADYSGKTENLGADLDGVGLPTATTSWRFTKFTLEQYNTLFAKLVDKTVSVDNESRVDVHPATTIVSVDYNA